MGWVGEGGGVLAEIKGNRKAKGEREKSFSVP